MTREQDPGSGDRNSTTIGSGVPLADGDGAVLARAVTGVIIPALCLAGLLLPVPLSGHRLADRVATHFDGSGAPDGSMTPWGLVLFAGLLLVLPGVVMLVAAAVGSRKMPRPWPPFAAGLGAFLGSLGAGIVMQTVVAQRDVADWTEAPGPGLSLGLVIVGPLVIGSMAAIVGRKLPYNTESTFFAADPGSEVPTMTIAEGERVVFTETIAPGWMLWLTAGFLAAAVVVAIVASWWISVVLAASALPLLLFCAMRVQADNNGLVVRSALLGWRFAKVGIAEVEQASVIDVEPMKWGGWGYRGSLKLAGAAAVVMRRGPGVHLKLTGDRVFVVTLDNPAGAAAVLNASRAEVHSR